MHRPAQVCRELLSALDTRDGRERGGRRAIKRELLERALADDPPPETFESWLVERCVLAARARARGALRTIAREILDEYRVRGRPAA